MRLYFKIVLFIVIVPMESGLVPVKLTSPSTLTVNPVYGVNTAFASARPDKIGSSEMVNPEYFGVNEQVSLPRFYRGLPGRMSQYKKMVKAEVSDSIIDWRLIMAIINQESQFDENAVSYRGAQGLMQLMPVTQMEFDDPDKIGANAFHPQTNIKMGINYFVKLYRLFELAPKQDRIKLTLAAYNAGPSRIYDAQDIAAYLGENPFSWRAIQNALPLLSKRYYTLHQSIWDGGKPRNGYFGSWRQTVSYVQKVTQNHEELLAHPESFRDNFQFGGSNKY
ncbi:MAG: transglycosylase SLT domain-containing protein [Bacteroidetes bacterium]|nr:transglycosylase SLT domain-containing protein [Bacteroidota bacterium]MBU1423519.1 transglycosylase SLT domain-containing protein [Bacteroidota bacterium]MBU2472353.1 transglycosylase SLT domain-containing protein [Bacteroidota bacterium]